jgi:hypothetical protein
VTIIAPNLTSASVQLDDELVHYHCCTNPAVALCGSDLSDSDLTDNEINCVVCDDLCHGSYWFCPVAPVCETWQP